MSGRQCVICAARIRDTWTCTRCRDNVRDAIIEAAWLDGQLEIAATRQARIGSAARRVLGAEPALPYQPYTADLRRELRAFLASWLGPYRYPRELYSRADHALRMERVGDFHHALAGKDGLNQRALKAINPREPWIYCGPCPNCGKRDLYAKPGENTGKCHPDCGHEFTVEERQRWMLDQSADKVAVATVIVNALRAMVQVELTVKQIHNWANARPPRLHDYGVEIRHGQPRRLYRIGDVIALAAFEQAKRDRREEKRSA